MHLYIIQSSNKGNFKIGRSKNPSKRLKQLQTGSPYKLKLVLVLENGSARLLRLLPHLFEIRLFDF